MRKAAKTRAGLERFGFFLRKIDMLKILTKTTARVTIVYVDKLVGKTRGRI